MLDRARIYRLFHFEHMTPPQIDALMELPRGTARRVIVEYWAWQRYNEQFDV